MTNSVLNSISVPMSGYWHCAHFIYQLRYKKSSGPILQRALSLKPFYWREIFYQGSHFAGFHQVVSLPTFPITSTISSKVKHIVWAMNHTSPRPRADLRYLNKQGPSQHTTMVTLTHFYYCRCISNFVKNVYMFNFISLTKIVVNVELFTAFSRASLKR